MKVYIWFFFFLSLISLVSSCLSFFQKDLPLPRKSSRWVLLRSLPPSLCLGSPGRRLVPPQKKNASRWETLPRIIHMLCFESSEDAWVMLAAWRLVFMWRRRRLAAGLLGVCRSLIKASQECWMLSKVLKGTATSAFVLWLAFYLPSSLPIAWLLIPFLFRSHSHPFAFLNPLFCLPLTDWEFVCWQSVLTNQQAAQVFKEDMWKHYNCAHLSKTMKTLPVFHS